VRIKGKKINAMSKEIAEDVNRFELPVSAQVVESFERFFKKVVRGSYPLFVATVMALIWANLSSTSYHSLWETQFSIHLGGFHITKSLVHWIDEALMALFFFTVGLEIKRELLVGELASPKRALLPIAAALGGMIFPAAIYEAFNYGTPAAHGWGIPMATDIAFSLAVLAMTIVWQYLLLSGLFLIGVVLANLLWIRWALVYAVLGTGMWFAILGSGVHATVAGVLVAMFIPAKARYDTDTFLKKVKANLDRFECEPESCGYTILLSKQHLDSVQAIEEACYDVETPLQRLEHSLQSWITLVILPLFALANAGLVIRGMDIAHAITHTVTLGVALGLLVGKPLGIFLFTYLASKTLKAPLPSGVNWSHVVGVGILGGIGFTMSLFISGLSFTSAQFIEFSKLGIILASLMSALAGLIVLSVGKASGSQSPNREPA
jgi:NhaA family Na+:H+ antiporter